MHFKRKQKFYSLMFVFVLLLSFVTSGFAPVAIQATEDEQLTTEIDTFDLSIMHLNDTHARVDDYPKLVTAVKDFRSENPDSLLLHAGDVFSGTLYFNEFRGQADLALLNLMGIDAFTFGNHEFDLGINEGGHQSLAEFIQKANFPFLGTNVDFSKDPFVSDLETGEFVARDANAGEVFKGIVKEVNGEEVGIFGLTTEDTVAISSVMEVKFENFVTAAEKAVEAFEAAGINKIIAVNHIGYDSALEVGNDLRLAREVDGIDVIVGGHSHTELSDAVLIEKEDQAPTVIVQAGQYAEHLGTLNVSFDDAGEIISVANELVAVADLAADGEAVEVLAEYKERIDQISQESIGAEALKELANPRQGDGNLDSVRANETELGNLITDAMLAKAKEKFPETVIAFQNGGGIRASIAKGDITVGDVMTVLPFGNDPVIATLTGQEIKNILEFSVRQAPNENGGFLHVSGMQFYFDSTKEVGNRIVKMSIDQAGVLTEIDLDTEYLVTTNNFTGQGGDGFETFANAHAEGRVRDIGEIDWEQLRDYMVEETYLNGIVDPVREGRIIDLQGEELPGETEEPGEHDPDTDPKPRPKPKPEPEPEPEPQPKPEDKQDEVPRLPLQPTAPKPVDVTEENLTDYYQTETNKVTVEGATDTDSAATTETDRDGTTLPATAIPLYNYLALGILLMGIGAVMIVIKRKRA